MALAGNFICSITGIDNTGGFHPSLKAIVDGLGYAAPPIMALLFILDVSITISWLKNSMLKPSTFYYLDNNRTTEKKYGLNKRIYKSSIRITFSYPFF